MVKTYIKEFKRNIKQSTAFWLTSLLLVLVLIADFLFCSKIIPELRMPVQIIIIGALLIIFMSLAWLFPMQAIFENSYKRAILNALRLTLAKLPRSILLLVVNSCPYFLLLAQGHALITTSFLFVIIGVSSCAWVNAHILSPVFLEWEVIKDDK